MFFVILSFFLLGMQKKKTQHSLLIKAGSGPALVVVV